MAHNSIEIELKFPLKNFKAVEKVLNKVTKLITKNQYQKDTYFTPKHRYFLKPKYPFEWLRLRETKNKKSINYKHFYPENTKITNYCKEFETEIASSSSLRKILLSLNFKKLVAVEKERSKWIYNEVEIAIDKVKNLGSYIELEALEPFSNPKEGKRYLRAILKKLNAKVGKEDYRGYPFLILKKEGYI